MDICIDFDEKNKLIAEFMGFEYKDWTPEYYQGIIPPINTDWFNNNNEICYSLKFNSSWDWLMEVVDKIVNKTHLNNTNHLPRQLVLKNIFDSLSTVNISNIYKAVTEFITWYNKQIGYMHRL